MPEVLDHLALALNGGACLGDALREVATRLGGSSGRELTQVAVALEWGVDDAAAWAPAGARLAPARRALSLAALAGVAPTPLLRSAAADVRREELARAEVATARLPVKLVIPLALAFLPAFVLTTVIPVVLVLAGDLIVGL